jgi:hypothetical protein
MADEEEADEEFWNQDALAEVNPQPFQRSGCGSTAAG